MSTYWDVYCRTCKEGAGLQENHNEQGMFDLIRAAPALATLPDGIGLGVESDRGSRLDMEWFRKHAGHELIPIDEYGRFSGQCSKWVQCSCCGTRKHCQLLSKHEGECSPSEVKP